MNARDIRSISIDDLQEGNRWLRRAGMHIGDYVLTNWSTLSDEELKDCTATVNTLVECQRKLEHELMLIIELLRIVYPEDPNDNIARA